MKLLFIENEGRLSNPFKENTNYQIFFQKTLNLLSMREADILIVDNKIVSHQDLLSKSEHFSDFKEIFFVTENKEIGPILMLHGIKPIFTDDPTIVLSTIEHYIYSESLENRVFVFMGADRKAGVTTITHAVAENLGATIDKKVLYINLSNNFNETIQDINSLDKLIPSLKLKNITVEELNKAATKIGNYYYIGSTEKIIDENKIDVEAAIEFYKTLKKQSEYIVLLDVGANPASPFYIIALDLLKNFILITKPQKSYDLVFKRVMEQIIKPYTKLELNDFLTVINGTYDYLDFLEKYNILAKVNYSQIGIEADNKGIPLYKLDDYFNEEISTISKYIALKVGYKPPTEEKKKGWFNKLLRNNRDRDKVGEKV